MSTSNETNDSVKLKAKTHRGKNHLRNAGTDTWRILEDRESVICLGNERGLLIQPTTEGPEERFTVKSKTRWIKAKHDPDFDIIS